MQKRPTSYNTLGFFIFMKHVNLQHIFSETKNVQQSLFYCTLAHSGELRKNDSCNLKTHKSL